MTDAERLKRRLHRLETLLLAAQHLADDVAEDSCTEAANGLTCLMRMARSEVRAARHAALLGAPGTADASTPEPKARAARR